MNMHASIDMKADLVALAYLHGMEGSFGTMAKQLLSKAIRKHIAEDLDPDERREFKQIRENVINEIQLAAQVAYERKNTLMAAKNQGRISGAIPPLPPEPEE